MSEKSISERGAETLKWIQEKQKANGLGMVDFDKIPDQAAARYLLRKGDVFEPQPGMIKSTSEPVDEDAEFPDHKPWVWRTPKPKRKGDVPEPYEFLAYPDWTALPSVVAEALRGMGFSGAPFLYEGYSYRKMMGGALRRKMVGTHSKMALLAELELSGKSEAELAELKQKIEDAIEGCRGNKKATEVQVAEGIVYYPKDGSFGFDKA
jgi:hypothetical protein